MPLLVRIALIAVAVAVGTLLVSWQRDTDRCKTTGQTLFFELRDKAPADRITRRVEETMEYCHGGEALVGRAVIMSNEGEELHALTLAREAVKRDPESFSAWTGLAFVLRESDPAQSRQARKRARELNPRYRPPS